MSLSACPSLDIVQRVVFGRVAHDIQQFDARELPLANRRSSAGHWGLSELLGGIVLLQTPNQKETMREIIQ